MSYSKQPLLLFTELSPFLCYLQTLLEDILVPMPRGSSNPFAGSTPLMKSSSFSLLEPIPAVVLVSLGLFEIEHLYPRLARLPSGPLYSHIPPGGCSGLGRGTLQPQSASSCHLVCVFRFFNSCVVVGVLTFLLWCCPLPCFIFYFYFLLLGNVYGLWSTFKV